MALWKDPSVKDPTQGDAPAASAEPAARPAPSAAALSASAW